MSAKNLFVAFEGGDGSGKFTQLHMAKDWLEDCGWSIGWSSEPNDNEGSSSLLGKEIKKVLRHERPMPSDPVEFQRMYVLERAQDIICHINPLLNHPEGKCAYFIERFAFSTLAYGMLSGIPMERLITLHEEVIGPTMKWPDLTIIFDVPGEVAAKRIAENRGRPEYFERAELFSAVRANYLAIAEHPRFRPTTIVIDGNRNKEVVFADVGKSLQTLIHLGDYEEV